MRRDYFLRNRKDFKISYKVYLKEKLCLIDDTLTA